MDQWEKVAMSAKVFFKIMYMVGCMGVVYLGTRCTMGRRPAGGGSAMFSWESLGPGIRVDVTLTCSTYVIFRLLQTTYTSSSQWLSLMLKAFFSRIMQPQHCKNYSRRVWGTWQNVLSFTLASKFPRYHIEHLWNVLDKHIWSMLDLMDLLLMFCARNHRARSEVLWCSCLNASELFWHHDGGLHDVRKVVLKG